MKTKKNLNKVELSSQYHHCGTFFKLFQYHHCGTFFKTFSTVIMELFQYHYCRTLFSITIVERFSTVLVPSFWNFCSTIIVEPFLNCLISSLLNLFVYILFQCFSLGLFAILICRLICSNKYIIVHILFCFVFVFFYLFCDFN